MLLITMSLHQTLRSHLLYGFPLTQDYYEINLMKEVMRSIGGDIGDAQTREDLERKLSRLIEGKRFFLDDVWNAHVWESLLRKPLSKGAHGWVLITTKNEHVARRVGAIDIHKVKQVPKEDSELFRNMLSIEGDEELANVWDIGMQNS